MPNDTHAHRGSRALPVLGPVALIALAACKGDDPTDPGVPGPSFAFDGHPDAVITGSSAVADFDADGFDDVVASVLEQGEPVSYLFAGGSAGPGDPQVLDIPATEVAAGDFDEDGTPDLAAVNADREAWLRVYWGGRAWTDAPPFRHERHAPAASYRSPQVVVGRHGHDRADDLAVWVEDAGTGAQIFEIYPGQPDRQFTLGYPFFEVTDADPETDRVQATGNVDGDGYGDFIFRNQRTEVTNPPYTYIDVYAHVAFAIGDVDADGVGDLLGCGPDADGRGALSVHRGAEIAPEWQPSLVVASPPDHAQDWRRLLYLGDTDGDGFGDVAVVGARGDTEDILVYGGSATLVSEAPIRVLSGLAPSIALATGDVNGDGLADLVRTTADPADAGRLEVWLGGT